GELPWLGEWMPGIMAHRGYSLDRVAGQLYLGQEGIFGLPLGVAARHPLAGEAVPVWGAQCGLMDCGPGAGLCVPARAGRAGEVG
ncbi:hypothetical protein P8631_20865, partial [Guyparkeria sp. 1SP6A2]|nr:hypothetical protein [Guyparkeria sp. 1SP6A2]